MLLLSGCGEWRAVQKSKDPEYKFNMAIQYFNEKKYVRAQQLLDEVTSYYKGTPRSEDILAYLSRCYMGQKDYTSASEYYAAYTRSYPKGKYIIEALYQVAHCKYLDAPDPKLDQTITKEAIEAYQVFIERHPESPYSANAYQEMEELYNKLAYKEYLNAKLYYNLGTYLGNNYLSCEVVAKNCLKLYPGNPYQEELYWLILQSKFQQTVQSFEDRKLERARDTQDECYSFLTEWPNSKHRAAAEKIEREMRKITKE